MAGRAGARALRQPDVRADHLHRLHGRLRHQLRGALPGDRRGPPGPERFTWGGIFCDREAARFRAVSTSAVRQLGLEIPEDAVGLLADQQRAPSRPSCSGTWSTTAPTATATCRSTPS
ncbi:DUF6421 family protein [Kitasatospora albolonga]|uniref:DUF6421 family protein n=1 Tax=Kitasatospora albolonga TaxID=68173 RepID=UPI003CD07C8E